MSESNERLKKRVQMLEYITITWNIFEGLAAIYSGVAAGSVALVAFGLSSGVEVLTSLVVLWQMKHGGHKEKAALRFIGSFYLITAVYIFQDSIHSLLSGEHPSSSPFGILLLFGTVIMMFLLGFLKKKAGKRMNNATVIAGANFTYVDGSVAFVVLLGLIANTLFGLWWLDQIMALFIGLFAFKEGIEELFSK